MEDIIIDLRIAAEILEGIEGNEQVDIAQGYVSQALEALGDHRDGLEHTYEAIKRALNGSLEGHFIEAVADCNWESALNRADQFHFAHFTEIMQWRLTTLPRKGAR